MIRVCLFTAAFIFVAPIATLASPTTLPYFDANQLTPYWPSEQKANRESQTFAPAVLTSFQVMDQDQKAITEKTLANQISLINFFFADCPNVCPTMMNSLKRFQKRLGKSAEEVKIFSFSVTPDRDSPEKLRNYSKSFGINLDHWAFLTGDRAQVYHVGKDMLKADGSVGSQKSASNFIHTPNIYLVDKKLHLRGIYDSGDAKAMALLVKDIARLKTEL